MKVALVHDYLNEYGGAEKVLETLSEMYPEAPIYTAFVVSGSTAQVTFKGKKIVTSWLQNLPYFWRLYSPLRFLIPWIWGSFDLTDFDVIISSASWYITKGFDKKPGAKEICYCHTPPRWLYGYTTSVDLQKYWPVRVYALVVGHFLRMYDFNRAQKVDVFVANSKNVAERIRKFYRRESEVIYPPVDLPKKNSNAVRGDYYLMVTRLVGGKGIELAIEAAKKVGFKLKIAGENAGFLRYKIQETRYKNIEFLGRVSEEEKWKLMAQAKGFLALSRDEDFGITPVEAQMAGTPVIAYDGGGYRESVVNENTGVRFGDYSVDGLLAAMDRFRKIEWNRKAITRSADKFDSKKFREEFERVVNGIRPRIREGLGR